VDLVKNAVQKCVDNIDGIASRNPRNIKSMFGALILSDVAIGMGVNSRPPSGSEHHMAHVWGIDAIENNYEHPLHGNAVGLRWWL
jgi:glycerol-1-phosphate dehydrogenase [NAD(P)+]